MQTFPHHTIDSFESRLFRIVVATVLSFLSGVGAATAGLTVIWSIAVASAVGVVALRVVREVQRSRSGPPPGMAAS